MTPCQWIAFGLVIGMVLFYVLVRGGAENPTDDRDLERGRRA